MIDWISFSVSLADKNLESEGNLTQINKMIFLLFFLPLASCQEILEKNVRDNATVFSVYWTKGRLNVKTGLCQRSHCVGEAIYENAVNKTGWAELQLENKDSFSEDIQEPKLENDGNPELLCRITKRQ